MGDKEKEFVVRDRRIFAQEDRVDDADEKKESAAEAAPPEEDESPPASAAAEPHEEAEAPLPEINFPTFVFSLNSSVLVHLGVIEDPATGKRNRNLPMAKQTIDILGMLEEKTKGNLSDDEAKMLKNILYELRMLYVKEKA